MMLIIELYFYMKLLVVKRQTRFLFWEISNFQESSVSVIDFVLLVQDNQFVNLLERR